MALLVLALFSCEQSVGDHNDAVHVDASVDHATSHEDVMGGGAGAASRDGAASSTDATASFSDRATSFSDGTASFYERVTSFSDRAESKDASRERITEEEWARITAPVTGTHDVDSFPSWGCPTHGIEQEFRIIPTVACAWSAAREFRECDVQRYCQRHTDCTERAFGRCRGSPSASCIYPDVPQSPCSSDSECTSLPGGGCPMVTEPNTPRCYPTGRCETPERRCLYQNELCSNDSECTSAPGGVCEKRILFARCEYQGCLEDGDCAAGQRCACASPRHLCVPGDCAADTDCEAGKQCLLARGCFGAPAGYHCTTPLDTCHANEECVPGSHCTFDGHWQCREKFCPPPP